MNKSLVVSLLGGLALAAGIPAGAATIRLQPSQSLVQPSQALTVALLIDATDVAGPNNDLFGGEVLIDFNPALLSYDGISLSQNVTFYMQPALGTAGDRQTLVFGFDNAPELGTVATLSFTATGNAGSTATIDIADNLDLIGSFASYYPGYQRFYPTFSGASIQVAPLPGAAWLMLTAFGVAGLRAHRSALMPRIDSAGR